MNSLDAAFTRYSEAVAAHGQSVARALQDGLDTRAQVLACLAQCPPEQAKVAEAIALLADFLLPAPSAPLSDSAALVADWVAESKSAA